VFCEAKCIEATGLVQNISPYYTVGKTGAKYYENIE
jgi:hypothetical protein